MEGHGSVGAGGEEAIGDHAVGVRIKIQCPAKALDEGDSAGLAVGDAQRPAASPLPVEDAAHIALEHVGKEGLVDRESESHRPRKGQHPLPVRRFGQDVVDQLGGRIAHAAGGT